MKIFGVHITREIPSIQPVGTVEDIHEQQLRLSRAMDNLQLDMDALYDKVKTALGRVTARDRRAKADGQPEGGNGTAPSAVDINQMILEGTFDGRSRIHPQ